MNSKVKREKKAPNSSLAKKVKTVSSPTNRAKHLVSRLNLRPLLQPEERIRKPSQLIEGLIEQKSIVGIIGPTASYKSFITTAICASVGSGAKCFGRKTKKGLVFFVSGEGSGGLHSRFAAYARHEKIRMEHILLHRTDSSLSLATDEVARVLSSELRRIAQEAGKKVALVCFDPLSKILDGIDENSASDMNALIHRLDRFFRQRLGATVILVHHTGHSNVNRARGSAAFEAALDTAFVVTRKSGKRTVTVRCTKQKDSAEAEPFELEAVTVRMKTETGTAESLALKLVESAKSKIEQVFGVLLRLLGTTKTSVEVAVWRDAVLSHGIVSTEKAFRRHKEKMLSANKIVVVRGKARPK
jgi:RecA-family ATPase